MIDQQAKHRAAEIRALPASVLDARLLADYVGTGEAFDLWELAHHADIPLRRVAHLVAARGLDQVDKLPGYTVTADIFELIEDIYACGASRREWQLVRTRHKPEYLEGRLSRQQVNELAQDMVAYRRYYAKVYFRSWAVFWDEKFLERMIERVDSRLIMSVPEYLLTEKICFEAVSRWGMALRYMPERFRSVAICARAVESDPAAIGFTPANLRDEVGRLARSQSARR
jgi:hypothetical protein